MYENGRGRSLGNVWAICNTVSSRQRGLPSLSFTLLPLKLFCLGSTSRQSYWDCFIVYHYLRIPTFGPDRRW
jgi:hypothetical protein